MDTRLLCLMLMLRWWMRCKQQTSQQWLARYERENSCLLCHNEMSRIQLARSASYAIPWFLCFQMTQSSNQRRDYCLSPAKANLLPISVAPQYLRQLLNQLQSNMQMKTKSTYQHPYSRDRTVFKRNRPYGWCPEMQPVAKQQRSCWKAAEEYVYWRGCFVCKRCVCVS